LYFCKRRKILFSVYVFFRDYHFLFCWQLDLVTVAFNTHATNTDVPTGQSDGLHSANLDDQSSLGHWVMVSVSTKYLNEQWRGGVAPLD